MYSIGAEHDTTERSAWAVKPAIALSPQPNAVTSDIDKLPWDWSGKVTARAIEAGEYGGRSEGGDGRVTIALC